MRITKTAGLAALVAQLALSACERADPRFEKLAVGMAKDSVLVVMGGEKPQRVDPYLYNGQYVEAMLYPKLGKSDSASLLDRNMTPVVVINGKLVGWGWSYWDSTAGANSIQVAPKP